MFPWESSVSVNSPARIWSEHIPTSTQFPFPESSLFPKLAELETSGGETEWLLPVRLKAVADQDQSNRTLYCLLGILGPPGRQPYCCELFQTSKIKSHRYSKTVCPHVHQTVEQDGLHAALIVTVSQHVDPKEKKETRSVVDLMQTSCP